ncbi:DUF4124 domain-containing protein [uncultured Thiodictyon sp.]|uniref:DUF4124 domain-containing protein n=1 Tax=uncultured Thiodictyon sp. TaxID=1846217 RepID=UPI0025D0D215|nr:DUF4124 domain-containing protein [uncultured Thiodictyon sp.]
MKLDYPVSVMRVVLVLFLTIAQVTSAQVFQWVDAEGRTQFADRPQASVERQYQSATAVAEADADTPAAPLLGPYSRFDIWSPGPDQTLRQPQNNVAVRLRIEPPVITGQQLEFVLDGAAVRTEKATDTQFTLTGLTFGSHEVVAQIRNILGTIVARTPAVPFQLRKPTPPGVLQ